MTQFDTGDPLQRSRRRDANGGVGRVSETALTTPGVAVQRPVEGSSDFQELRRILGPIAQATSAMASLTAAQRAEVERKERLRADRLTGELLLTYGEQIASGSLLPGDGTDTEGILDYYESIATRDADRAELEGEARERFISNLGLRLAQSGLQQINSFRQKELDSSLAEYTSALASNTGDDDVAQALEGIRALLPNATEAEVDSHLVDAMQAAAELGNRAAFERLAPQVNDTDALSVARAKHTLSIRESQAASEAAQTAYTATTDAVSQDLMGGKYEQARRRVEQSGLSPSQQLSLKDSIDRREASANAKAADDAYSALSTRVEVGLRAGEDVQGLVEQGVADGVLTFGQLDGFRDEVRARRTEAMRTDMAVAQEQPTDQAIETMNRVVGEAYGALLAGQSNPDSFGAITSAQYDRIRGEYEAFIQPLRREQIESDIARADLQASMRAGGTYFGDVTVGDVTVSASDRAENARVSAYQHIESSLPPERQAAAKIDWLAQNPQAKDDELAGTLMGASAAALTAMDNPEVLPVVRGRVEAYRSLKERNGGVALRHTTDGDRTFYEAVDVLKRAMPSMPTDDAIRFAAKHATGGTIIPRSEVLGTPTAQAELAERNIKSLIKGVNGELARREFLERLYAVSSMVGTRSVNDFAKVIAEDMKREYAVIDGSTVYLGGANVDRRGVESISRMAATIFAGESEWEQDDLVLSRNPLLGQWALVSRDNGLGVGGVLLSDSDVARIVAFQNELASYERTSSGAASANRVAARRFNRYRAGLEQSILMNMGRDAMAGGTDARARASAEADRILGGRTASTVPETAKPTFDPNDKLAPFFRMILDGNGALDSVYVPTPESIGGPLN